MTAPEDCCYTCQGCTRTVCADLEPSPGEPRRCGDCSADLARELDDVAGAVA